MNSSNPKIAAIGAGLQGICDAPALAEALPHGHDTAEPVPEEPGLGK